MPVCDLLQIYVTVPPRAEEDDELLASGRVRLFYDDDLVLEHSLARTNVLSYNPVARCSAVQILGVFPRAAGLRGGGHYRLDMDLDLPAKGRVWALVAN